MHIILRDFKRDDPVLLFKSRTILFPEKLRSRWFGPFQFQKVYHLGEVEIWSEKTRSFNFNVQRLQKYRLNCSFSPLIFSKLRF